MVGEVFRQELVDLREGRLPFELFHARTRDVWDRLARNLLRKWRAPASVSVDDIIQELVLHAWLFVPKWDPVAYPGVTLDRYVVYNSCDKAKKWLHRARNAYRRDDKSPGRFEIPFSAFHVAEKEYAEEWLEAIIATEAVQERDLVLQETMRDEANATGDLCILALSRTGAIETAAELLFNVKPARLALRLESLAAARAAVESAIERAALRLGTA